MVIIYFNNIYSRQSSPPLPHRLQCSGSQESFAADSYCGGNSGIQSSSSQWQLSNCGASICQHHNVPASGSSLPNASTAMPSTNLIHSSASASAIPYTNGGNTTMPPIPPLCNPCSSNSFNSVAMPVLSRWGPRTSCPVHSPYRVRVPNGSICSGHQVNTFTNRFVKSSHTKQTQKLLCA